MIEIWHYHYVDLVAVVLMVILYGLILLPPFFPWKGVRRLYEIRQKRRLS